MDKIRKFRILEQDTILKSAESLETKKEYAQNKQNLQRIVETGIVVTALND